MWVAHEAPERPLAYGAHLCPCDLCAEVLKKNAVDEPTLMLVLKTSMRRFMISIRSAAHWLERGEPMEDWLLDPEYLRDVYVVDRAEIKRARRRARREEREAGRAAGSGHE